MCGHRWPGSRQAVFVLSYMDVGAVAGRAGDDDVFQFALLSVQIGNLIDSSHGFESAENLPTSVYTSAPARVATCARSTTSLDQIPAFGNQRAAWLRE